MLLGPSLFIILGGRFLFTILAVWIMMQITRTLPDKVWRTMLTNNNVPEKPVSKEHKEDARLFCLS